MKFSFPLALASMFAGACIAPEVCSAQSSTGRGTAMSVGQAGPGQRSLAREALLNARPMPMPQLTEEEGLRLFRGKLPATDAAPPAPAILSRGNINDKPLRWAGQVYHMYPNNSYFYCSGQFIDKNIVLTAAHCIIDKNSNYRGPLVFYLQYENGSFSQEYKILDGKFWRGYLDRNFDHWRWDYAILCTEKASTTGFFSYTTEWADDYAEATSIGYPWLISKSELIQVVSGTLTLYEPGIYELNHGVDKFLKGSSGGAWIGDYSKKNGRNNVISVNSFFFGGDKWKGRIFGPYLDENFDELLALVRKSKKCR